MIYRQKGEWRELVRITGPSHNLLGLSLRDSSRANKPKIEVLGDMKHSKIEKLQLLREVTEGVEEANSKHGTNFVIFAVRYVADDTPSQGVYRYLAREIVKRAADERRDDFKIAAG